MKRAALAGLILLLGAGLEARAGAELTLKDGTRIAGESVEQKEGLYFLELAGGAVVPIPAELVVKLRLTGGDAPPPTGLTYAEPKTLAGLPPDFPTFREQIAAFGRPPVVFHRPPTDYHWRPTSSWPPGANGNDFNPVHWYRPPIDPVWSPESVFNEDNDVTDFNPVRWVTPSITPFWRPRDGWAATRWFAPVATPPEE